MEDPMLDVCFTLRISEDTMKHITRNALITAFTLSSVTAIGITAFAAATKYTVPTAEQFAAQNVFTIESETAIENFTARTNKVSGSVDFDASAKTGSATITVDGASIDTGVALRNEHMRSADWFNFDKNPEVKFVTTSVKNTSGDKYAITGNLTLNGITKKISSSATVRLTKANDMTKMIGFGGDAVGIVAKFKIKITDFGAKHPAIAGGRVAETLDATLRIVASDK
jgi:polyisoprenoid-binding protein YceI